GSGSCAVGPTARRSSWCIVRARSVYLAVAACAVIVYLGALWNEFVWDDQVIVLGNPLVQTWAGLATAFASPYWPPFVGGYLYRPLTLLTYVLDWHIGGAAWFHVVNLSWHAGVSALVAVLARRWAGDAAALVAGMLFAVHPVHVEAVANVVGRAELMAAAGYAAALLCAIRAERKPAYLAGVAAGAAFAIASKEVAVTLPAAVFLVYVARRAYLRTAWKAVVAATVPIAAYFIVHVFVGIRTFYAGGLAVGLEHVGFLARSWTMVRLSLQWWRLFLFPAHLSADYSPGELTVA